VFVTTGAALTQNRVEAMTGSLADFEITNKTIVVFLSYNTILYKTIQNLNWTETSHTSNKHK